MSTANVELARRGFSAALSGDYETIAKLLHPDVKWHGGDPHDPAGCHNREEALAFMQAARRRRPLGALVEVIDAGDKVVVVTRPDPDDSSRVVANVSTFRDGQVIEMVHFPDVEQALVATRGG